ncbi:MAG TPA: response regulator [Dehalococcoidia bacterium]|nr:response regulator [Dehalococcoidia bacterium]
MLQSWRCRMTAESHPLVLLIGDPEFLELAELAISKCGYTVLTAQSGLDGLRLFQEQMTDLVVLDPVMRGMDGIDTLRLIREFSNCPIIILTLSFMPIRFNCAAADRLKA